MKIDTVKMIEDFNNLLLCPELKNIFFHKIEELKYKDSAVIEKIVNLKRKLRLEGGGNNIEMTDQPFQLFKINNRWYPSIPGEQDRLPYDLIPRELIDVIVSDNIGTDQIVMHREIEIQGVINCVVSYGKFEDYYNGTIKEIWRKKEERPKLMDRDDGDLKERLKVIEMMVDYLLDDRRYFEHASKDFKFWRNLVDQKNKAI